MIESWAIRLEVGILLWLNREQFVARIEFRRRRNSIWRRRKKDAKKLCSFITNRYFNIEKVSESSWDTIHGWINSSTFRLCIKICYKKYKIVGNPIIVELLQKSAVFDVFHWFMPPYWYRHDDFEKKFHAHFESRAILFTHGWCPNSIR